MPLPTHKVSFSFDLQVTEKSSLHLVVKSADNTLASSSLRIADFRVRQRVRMDRELLQHNVMPSKVGKPTTSIYPHINGFGFLTRSGNTLTLSSSPPACLHGLLALVLRRV